LVRSDNEQKPQAHPECFIANNSIKTNSYKADGKMARHLPSETILFDFFRRRNASFTTSVLRRHLRNLFVLTTAMLALCSCAKQATHQLEVQSQNPTLASGVLNVPWTFEIHGLQRNIIGHLTVRFTDTKAPSCIIGDWKRIEVVNYRPLGEPAFPGNDPLSYTFDGRALVIGRNEICDGYVMLSGNLADNKFSGDYVTFGLRGAAQRGYANGAPSK
jgi:hypothetical protein